MKTNEKQPTKRFYGNPVIGEWFVPSTVTQPEYTLYPVDLEERQQEFDWIANNEDMDALFPHLNGIALEYGEAE